MKLSREKVNRSLIQHLGRFYCYPKDKHMSIAKDIAEIAMRMTGLDWNDAIDYLLMLGRSQEWKEYSERLKNAMKP